MIAKIAALLAVSVSVLVAAPCAGAGAAPRNATVVDGPSAQAIDFAMTSAAVLGFGGAVLIEVKGKPILSAGYGYADREKKIPFTIDTVAQIGSITKPMTALAILELAREGRLDLAKPVKTYLPGAAEPAGSATLAQLLTHHAGLADTCGDDFDRVSKQALLHRCMALPLAHPIGEDHYSNMGFSILAAVVEQVSGQTWETYLRQHIWSPLGMRRTGFVHFDHLQKADFAVGYQADKPQPVISDSIAALGGQDWDLKGNGGIQASTTDMERFYRALSGKLAGVAPEVVRGMTTPQAHLNGEAWEGYGLAVRLDTAGQVYRIGHSGSDGIFWSYFGWLPQQDVFIYLVGNNGEKNVAPLAGATVKTVQAMAGVHPQPADGK